jgi:phosphate:Na+ symporter
MMANINPMLTTLLMVTIGLLLFLYGMKQLENGIRELGYSSFKRWIASSTASSARSAALGAAITAALQSSSLVGLLVLAFAGAGVLPLYNAMGIMIGANLGTTVTGWMVAAIGFKLSLQMVALPAMAAGAGLQMATPRWPRLLGIGAALFGIGLIIFGLDIMNDAVGQVQRHWDISRLGDHGPWLYFLAGAIVAALIQSSSATMMMTLAALNGGLIDLPIAAAIVIGADLGTTSTTGLGSIGGHPIKRQLALGHFLFNLIVDVGAFVLLLPLLPALLNLLHLEDPLFSLVAFHSLFNLIGVIVFLPLLKPASAWLAHRFLQTNTSPGLLAGLPTGVPDAALLASAKVLADMRVNAAALILHEFQLAPDQLQLPGEQLIALRVNYEQRLPLMERYLQIKKSETELLAFAFDIQGQPLSPAQAEKLDSQTREARALVYSCKNMMDIREDIAMMRHHVQPPNMALYKAHRGFLKLVYQRYLQLSTELPGVGIETCSELYRQNDEHYQRSNIAASVIASSADTPDIELSTALNVNHEIHHAIKDLIAGRQPVLLAASTTRATQ